MMSLRQRLSAHSTQLRRRREVVSELLRPLEASASVTESLDEAAAEHDDALVRDACRRLARDLVRGEGLGDSLDRLRADTGLVDRATVALARAGERAERPDEALRTAERLLDIRAVIAARARDAWIEPLVTIVIGIAVLAVLLAGPLAALSALTGGTPLLESLARTPRLTAGVVLASGLLALLLTAVLARSVLDSGLVERVPLAGRLDRDARRATLCRSLALGLEAGVDFPEAVDAASDALRPGSRERKAFETATARARAGATPEESAEPLGTLGPLFVAVLARPASATTTARGFALLADFHEAELERVGRFTWQVVEIVAVFAAGAVAAAIVIGTWATYFDATSSMPW